MQSPVSLLVSGHRTMAGPPPGFPAAPHQMFRRIAALPREMATAPPPPPAPTAEVELSDFDWVGDLGEGGFARVTKKPSLQDIMIAASQQLARVAKEFFYPGTWVAI
ncbi:hypothetical protein ACP4OV_025489 [Aristida adscensionis]